MHDIESVDRSKSRRFPILLVILILLAGTPIIIVFTGVISFLFFPSPLAVFDLFSPPRDPFDYEVGVVLFKLDELHTSDEIVIIDNVTLAQVSLLGQLFEELLSSNESETSMHMVHAQSSELEELMPFYRTEAGERIALLYNDVYYQIGMAMP